MVGLEELQGGAGGAHSWGVVVGVVGVVGVVNKVMVRWGMRRCRII